MKRLLLHGFTGTPELFGHADADSIAPALPGHGSAPPATSWNAAVAQLAALLNEGAFILGGYSMGARLALAVALAVALRAPGRVERLVLESGSPGLEHEADRAARRVADEGLAQLLEREGIDAFLRRWEANPALAGQPHAALRAGRRSHRAEGLASVLRHLGQGAQPSLWSQLPKLQTPTLLVVGERDEKYVAIARRMQALLPRAELQIIEGAGHYTRFDWRTA